MDIGKFVYMLCFCLVMCYLAYLSGFILSYKRIPSVDTPNSPVVRNISNAVGGFILIWALLFAIYIPLFIYVPLDGNHDLFPYQLAYFADLIFWLPSVCYLSQALLQYKFNKWIWLPLTTIPVLACFVWFLIDRGNLPIIVTAVVVLVSFVIFACCYSFSYRHYMRRLKSEYSNLSRRDVRWTIYAYIGLVIQLIFYFYDFFFYSLFTSLLYDVTTVLNAMFITHCARRMLPIDEASNTEKHEAKDENSMEDSSWKDNDADGVEAPKALIINVEMIRQRLVSHCESTKLYLDPQLTRDALCRNIGVNKNYLAQYFRENNISYYHYINTLRINYACELLSKPDADIPIKDLALMVGYTSYRSFYNSFCEIKGCKPSDYLKTR